MLGSFVYCVGTKILFGNGMEEKLPEELKVYGHRVLLVYGGGSIKHNGLYLRIKELLSDFEIFELAGVESNPRIGTVRKGASICREQNIEVLLAVGGGSTIDCAKVVAAAACYDGDAWELVKDPKRICSALPITTVLTIAATGSEMDAFAVISNPNTKEKLGMAHPSLLPRLSVLDPENTFSVPARQTAAGAVDILSHILESYFNLPRAAVPDRISEGLIRTIIQYAPIAIREPENYEARAQLMWTSSLAINGLCSTGKSLMWSCHPIEHELSAYYDITHGIGLAILTPNWMRYILNEKTVNTFVEYAVNVWGFDPAQEEYALARQSIDATAAFFRSLGIPEKLSELGIDESCFTEMSRNAVRNGALHLAYIPLTEKDVYNIYEMCK